MGVLKDIDSLMTQDEITQNEKEYLDETAHLRAAREAIAKSLAEYVTAAMKAKGISQNELRRELNISSATMTEIVNGRGNPTIETIAKFGLILGKIPRLVWDDPEKAG
ncbi:MAG TPA: helix-turn-helix transcriptional regulator [Oligoflexus sp.]|uniref:helix-turn-helix domain-containing protein n=1 Tax=Oligoflexus sp. TaxID=1971216 RepID=UPI002D21FCC3|nr:helix-turn-helix transcriptional regulator [Oligoflexus sp.]HYX34104.1 helix-turn-helix transcriptional regulator [Oligoflexus sp.]